MLKTRDLVAACVVFGGAVNMALAAQPAALATYQVQAPARHGQRVSAEAVVEEIRAAETARFGAERLAELGLAVPFHRAVAQRAIRRLKADHPGEYRLTVLVCDFEGQAICRVEEDECA